jgi:hypothetical protein
LEEVSSGSDYRKGKRQVVQLPSGHKFLIKKPSGKTLTKLLNIFEGEITEADLGEEHVKQLLKSMSPQQIVAFIEDIMASCVLRPKIVSYDTEKDNEVWVEDIDVEDYVKLFEAVMKFSQMTAGGLDEASFPGKGNDRPLSGLNSTPGRPEA